MVSERRAFGHLRLIPRLLSGTSRRIKVAYRVVSAEMQRRRKAAKKVKNPIDRVSQNRRSGRPPAMRPSEIRGRADNFRFMLGQVWDRLEPRLSRAKTDQEVIDAFVQEAQPYAPNFMPSLANLVFRTLREPKFPKRRTARMNFLADSLAGLGLVAPRSSRDICQKERIREKRAHHILRYEFYVECSCGFKGQSRNHACPECGTKIDFGLGTSLRLT